MYLPHRGTSHIECYQKLTTNDSEWCAGQKLDREFQAMLDQTQKRTAGTSFSSSPSNRLKISGKVPTVLANAAEAVSTDHHRHNLKNTEDMNFDR